MVDCACWCTGALVLAAVVSVVTYLVPWFLDSFLFCEQNLKKKYNAEWAVVTGASSGIGLALVEKLAEQELNVVMVALDDKVFADAYEATVKKFPGVKFRKVGVNLSKAGAYLEPVAKACEDIKPNLIFNNAGYIATGLFAYSDVNKQLANYECNATAPVVFTHYFASHMIANKQRGAIFFTSSPAGLMPCPMTVMYGATKAFLTEFGTSIAAELHADGIDVLVVHPSPVNTSFYSGNKHNISAMAFFQKTATTPAKIAACFFRSVGRTVVHDQGYFSISLRFLLKLLDYNFLSIIIARTTATSADFIKAKKRE